MYKLLKTLTLLAFFPTLACAQQKTTSDRKPAPVLAVVQTDASRPGDELLDCDGLEKELVASMNDPALQSHFAKYGAQKKQQSTLTTKTQTTVPKLSAFASTNSTNASIQQAQVTQRATQNLQERVQQMNDLLPIAAQLMRGQRVMQLAQAHSCQWLLTPATERSTGHEAGH